MHINKMHSVYGLLGKQLSHSFSKIYFTEKFKREHILNTFYELFELPSINQFPALIQNRPDVKGLNVTIPYKEAVIPFLSYLSEEAKQVGAVNTIQIRRENDQLTVGGYNTDVIGFRDSLLAFLRFNPKKALVLGYGGAAKAVCYVLRQLKVEYVIVSRSAHCLAGEKPDLFKTYLEIDKPLIDACELIINCTPIGMYPAIEDVPPLPYQHITEKHILYDLVYNPEHSLFLKKGLAQGAQIKNGMEMLLLQAEASWKIWNNV